jgi:capsid protein
MYHLRKIGASVGIPVEMIMSTIGQSSFSASQGLLLQYQGALEENQRGLSYFFDRVYRWKVAKWIAEGVVKVPSDVDDPFQARWQSPAFRWVNKSAQVQADIRYVQLGAQSLDDIASQFGYTADSVLRRKAQNIKQAQDIAAEYGLESWRELFNPMQVTLQGNYAEIIADEDEAETEPNKPKPKETP